MSTVHGSVGRVWMEQCATRLMDTAALVRLGNNPHSVTQVGFVMLTLLVLSVCKKCQCLFTVLTAAEKTANPTDCDKQLAVKGYRATQSDHD